MTHDLTRRAFLRTVMVAAAVGPGANIAFSGEISNGSKLASAYKTTPACWRDALAQLTFQSPIGDYFQNVTEHWLKVAPRSNPAMLDMFRDRDRLPLRDLVPWAGEFAGKYLTSAVQVYRCRRDAA